MTDYHAYLAERYPNPPDDAEHKIDRYTKWPYRYWPVDEMNTKVAGKLTSLFHIAISAKRLAYLCQARRGKTPFHTGSVAVKKAFGSDY